MGREVARLYQQETGKQISYGTLYTTLRRMRQRGWVRMRRQADSPAAPSAVRQPVDSRLRSNVLGDTLEPSCPPSVPKWPKPRIERCSGVSFSNTSSRRLYWWFSCGRTQGYAYGIAMFERTDSARFSPLPCQILPS